MANTWTQVFLNYNAENAKLTDTAIISIGVRQSTDKGAMSFWVDDVRIYKYGEVTLLSNTANVVNSDTDAKLCIYDNPRFITPAIKNRLGSTQKLRATLWYN